MEERILSSIENAISQLPRLPFEKIATPQVEKMQEHDQITKQKLVRKVIPLFARAMPIAAVVALAVFGWYNQFAMVDTTIQLDVNPSIEMTLNKREKVLDVRGLNPDGNDLIQGDKYKNQTVSKAIEHIMEEMVEKEYINKDTDVILVSTGNKDRQDRERMTEIVSDTLTLSSVQHDIYPQIYTQELYEDDYISDQSGKIGISRGKMQLIQTMMEQDSSLELTNLSKLSIKELILLAKDKGLMLYLDQKAYPNLGINIGSVEDVEQELEESSQPESSLESSITESSSQSSEVEVSRVESQVEVSQKPESSTVEVSLPESSQSSTPEVSPESSQSPSSEPDTSTGAAVDSSSGATPDSSSGATYRGRR